MVADTLTTAYVLMQLADDGEITARHAEDLIDFICAGRAPRYDDATREQRLDDLRYLGLSPA